MSEQQTAPTLVSTLPQLRALAAEIFAAHGCQVSFPEPSIINGDNRLAVGCAHGILSKALRIVHGTPESKVRELLTEHAKEVLSRHAEISTPEEWFKTRPTGSGPLSTHNV